MAWTSSNQYLQDTTNQSFLFSLTLKEKYTMANNAYLPNTIYNGASYGPTFGGGHDLYISDQANISSSSYSNIPISYQFPGRTAVDFTGAYSFSVLEY